MKLMTAEAAAVNSDQGNTLNDTQAERLSNHNHFMQFRHADLSPKEKMAGPSENMTERPSLLIE